MTPVSNTPLLKNDNLLSNENQINNPKPLSLTRIRFFGSTYLWDKINNNIYNDDITENNNNFTLVGKMELNQNNKPSKIIFS